MKNNSIHFETQVNMNEEEKCHFPFILLCIILNMHVEKGYNVYSSGISEFVS